MPICSASACDCWTRHRADTLCMPETERIRGSRMREIRTSGLKRAEAVEIAWQADIEPHTGKP
jgi:hypothetical protein